MSSTQSTVTREEIRTHSAWMNRLARRLVGPALDGEDLVQETWTTAVRVGPGRERSLRPWLRHVLRNFAWLGRRAEIRRRARERGYAEDRADEPLPTPAELLSRQRMHRLVADIVAQLEEPYRSTILLCYAEEVPPSEVARRQDVPASTVRSRLKRGLELIRGQLEARFGYEREAWRGALLPAHAIGEIATVGVGATLGAKIAIGLAVAVAVAGGVGGRAIFLGQTVTTPVTHPAFPHAQVVSRPPTATSTAVERVMETGAAPTLGPDDARVTMVVFTDFQCPFCSRHAVTVRQLRTLYPNDLRIVIKQLPLPFHQAALPAAKVALAAHEQGRFWEMHDLLFLDQTKLAREFLDLHAQAIGLDMARFRAALDDDRLTRQIEDESNQAAGVGLNGTPSSLINGRVLNGAQPIDAFKAVIELEMSGPN